MTENAKFPKAEKLCGKSDIAALMAQGRRGGCACLRYCCRIRPEGDETSGIRVMVSVPKKHFKRAVKRNLLKRRIREAYRLNKENIRKDKDIIIVARKSAKGQGFTEISSSLMKLLKRCGLLENSN